MENSSKALLMAGGVLIGILILSLATVLYTSFRESATVTEERIETDRINQFNSQFYVYVGKTLDIYDVIKIASIANESNIKNGFQESQDANENSLYVQVKAEIVEEYENLTTENYENLEMKLSEKKTWLQANSVNVNYTCTVKYSEKTGRVNLVEIEIDDD